MNNELHQVMVGTFIIGNIYIASSDKGNIFFGILYFILTGVIYIFGKNTEKNKK